MHILALTAANPKKQTLQAPARAGDGGPDGAGSAVAGSRGQTLGLHSTGNMLTVATASRTDRPRGLPLLRHQVWTRLLEERLLPQE